LESVSPRGQNLVCEKASICNRDGFCCCSREAVCKADSHSDGKRFDATSTSLLRHLLYLEPFGTACSFPIGNPEPTRFWKAIKNILYPGVVEHQRSHCRSHILATAPGATSGIGSGWGITEAATVLTSSGLSPIPTSSWCRAELLRPVHVP
jgi:hypothetical protein